MLFERQCENRVHKPVHAPTAGRVPVLGPNILVPELFELILGGFASGAQLNIYFYLGLKEGEGHYRNLGNIRSMLM